MLAAVNAFADQIVPTEVDPQLVTSKALSLQDGTVADGGTKLDGLTCPTW